MLSIFKFRRSWCVFLTIPAAALTALGAKYPSATERIYSTGIYPVISRFFARITNLVPFSIFEIIVLALPLLVAAYVTATLRKTVKLQGAARGAVARLISSLLCVVGVVWFGFTALCGLNYHRESFASASRLIVRPSSTRELAALCSELIAKTNAYAQKVSRNESNAMVSSFKNHYEAAAFAPFAYSKAGEQYPALLGFTPKPKPIIASRLMSVLDLVGIYFPFTFEANVNIDVPAYEIPSSMLHELAHYKGFMREDEANFIAYRVCLFSGNDDFVYSGLMLALIHSTNALYSADKDAYWELAQYFDKGVYADFNANADYWRQFEGPAADFSEKVNDVYLKTNRQTAGVKSYGRMVDLLLAQYRKDHGIE